MIDLAALRIFATLLERREGASTLTEHAVLGRALDAAWPATGLTMSTAISRASNGQFEERYPSQYGGDVGNAAREEVADWHKGIAARRDAILASHSSEEAVFTDTPREAALREACVPLLGRGEAYDTIYRLSGWDERQRAASLPKAVRDAVADAWPLPATIAEAITEWEETDRLDVDRCAVAPGHEPHLFSLARRLVVEGLIATLPASTLPELRARLAWFERCAEAGVTQYQSTTLAQLRTMIADVDRIAAAQPIAEAGRKAATGSASPSPTQDASTVSPAPALPPSQQQQATPAPVQPLSTREKRAAVSVDRTPFGPDRRRSSQGIGIGLWIRLCPLTPFPPHPASR